jgi:hypothetical protein
MGSQSQAGSRKKPPAKKAAKAETKTQRERFIEAARDAGVDETGEEFERAVAKIIKPSPRKS